MLTLQFKGNLFSELIARIAVKLQCAPHQVASIKIDKTKTEVLYDKDVWNLIEDEVLEVSIDLNSTTSNIFVHDGPKLTYAEYVKLHYAPPWAAFFVIGSDKLTAEEEQQIINALLSCSEVTDETLKLT